MLIVVPVVQTHDGEAAIEQAAEEARLRGGHLLLVGRTAAEQGQDAPGDRALLEDLKTRLESQGLECEIHWSVGGLPLDEVVLHEARTRGADLIVMGLRHRSRVGKLLLGSYEQVVLLSAECPVVSVRAHAPR